MGNPHPTKSKPDKIGWRHTGGLSPQAKARRARGRAMAAEIRCRQVWDRYHREVARYWAGERDTHPKMPDS